MLSLDTLKNQAMSPKPCPRQGSRFRSNHCPLLLVLLENSRLCYQMEGTKVL